MNRNGSEIDQEKASKKPRAVFWKRSLIARLVGSFLFLSLISVGLAGYLAFISAEDALTQAVFERLELFATREEEQLIRWVDHQRQDVIFLASLPDVRVQVERMLDLPGSDAQTAYRNLKTFLDSTVQYKPDLKEILILSDRDGKILLSTDIAHEGEYRIKDSYYKKGRSSTYVQNVYPSPIEFKPTLTISTPLIDNNRQRIGVLAVHLNLERMELFIGERTGLGETGTSYLVDKYKVFISSRRFGSDHFPRGVHSFGINKATQGNDGADLYNNHLAVPVIGVYRWIEELELALLVEISQKEAFAPALQIAQIIIVGGAILALILGTGIVILARQIARPILSMTDTALRVADGDLEATVPVVTQDEIGILARTFNEMTERLRFLYKDLRDEITERKQAETALVRSEARYRRLFEDALSGNFIMTSDGDLLDCNPAFARIFGFPDVKSALQSNMEVLYPDRETWQTFLSDLKSQKKFENHEIELRRQDDTPVYVIQNVIGTLNQDDILEIQGFVIDDTNRHDMEKQFVQSQRMESLGTLAGGIAHDFNNLLTIINGYSEMILSKMEPDDRLFMPLEEIKYAGERAALLTSQILSFSRQQVIQPKIVNLKHTIGNIGSMMLRLIGENIELIIEVDDDINTIKIDPVQVEQIIINLVVNARDAMPKGGRLVISAGNVDLTIDHAMFLDELSAGSYVALEISDTGVGIDDATMDRIFEPFFTTKAQHQGTGLGLSTVYGIVTQNNGAIRVNSRLDEGTTFSIYFPIADSDNDGVVPKQSSDGITEPSMGEKLLLIEDDAALRMMTQKILETNGYEVEIASDGVDALDRIASLNDMPIELLITDVVMPRMGGTEVAQRLTAMYPDLKVLYISGYFDRTGGDNRVLGPEVNYLLKPFTAAGLLQKVREILDQPA